MDEYYLIVKRLLINFANIGLSCFTACTFIIPNLLQERGCYTSLLVACQFGYAKIVKTLIDRGADVNYQSEVLCTCIIIIIMMLTVAQIVIHVYLSVGRVNCTDAGHPKEPCQDCPDVTGRQS